MKEQTSKRENTSAEQARTAEPVSSAKNKKNKSSSRSPVSKAVFALVMTLAIGVFLISGLKLISILTTYKKAEESYKEVQAAVSVIEENVDYPTINFAELLAVNPETVGYIFCKDLFEYPVVQGTDNDKYLYTLFNGEYNPSGSIFLDCQISEGLEAQNAIIYGHNMHDGSMFAPLLNYSDPAFCDAHRVYHVYTPEHHYVYEVASVYKAEIDGFTYQYSFADRESFQKFLDQTKAASFYDCGIEITPDNKIITLSTCTDSYSDDVYRYVVVLVRTGEITDSAG